ncbi:hypothetical protein HHK36_019425 [Tetracentron sinense]|uniref:Glutaredoxin domain-containing protein n=1 Tax=Tetracentron sinense TaxID=13715 RepID=A0A835DCR5_TETSI|nr:hypothetical protein HHK36_019425 [Tetracentron sinense]
MKGVKGRFLKKLKSIRPVLSVKQTRILQVNASDGFLDPSPNKDSNTIVQTLLGCKEQDQKLQEPDIIDISELMRDLEEEEEEYEMEFDSSNKENIWPLMNSESKSYNLQNGVFSEQDLSSSSNLCHTPLSEIETHEPEMKTRDEEENPLLEFEEKSPPGGNETVILYTTSLRGIRKTFEDCNKIRFLLGSFQIVYCERDVSMHLEFRDELWRILGRKVVPPRLFIKGRYIGGVAEIVELHEEGKLLKLLEGVPYDRSDSSCEGCGGIRFVLCLDCSGSYLDTINGSGISLTFKKNFSNLDSLFPGYDENRNLKARNKKSKDPRDLYSPWTGNPHLLASHSAETACIEFITKY